LENVVFIAFSALTLLVWQQEWHLAYKNLVVGYWHGYVPGSRRRFASGQADVTATHYPVNPDWFYFSGASLPS